MTPNPKDTMSTDETKESRTPFTHSMVVDGGEALRGHVPVAGCSCRWDEDGNPPPDCDCGSRITDQLRGYAYRVLEAAMNVTPDPKDTPAREQDSRRCECECTRGLFTWRNDPTWWSCAELSVQRRLTNDPRE